MGTTIEEATRIGQSVQDYLTDADTYDPEATDDRTEILLKRLASLRGVGLVTETQLMVLHDALISGGIVEDPKADPYTVGGVLITTARRFPYYGGSLPAGLLFVAEAAVAGADHGGPVGALTCASLASVRVLYAHVEDAPQDDGPGEIFPS
ncbi:hypothetical protein GCM10009765_70680 [Fodinicola feengrottensis]|uniref:Uncharacterized protein n=1 Tax=Fodinicola feengrottensis TaxID=435914 RepID=A0ABP4USU1_9ACTN